MFRLLNFKWDGSHRVRPSCDNFRSKLVESPSLDRDQAKSHFSQEKAKEAMTNHSLTDQEDKSIARLEAFISKMGQYQAHMKKLEGKTASNDRYLLNSRAQRAPCRPKCSIQRRKLQTQSKARTISSSVDR